VGGHGFGFGFDGTAHVTQGTDLIPSRPVGITSETGESMPFEEALDELISRHIEKSPDSSPPRRPRKKKSTPKLPSPRSSHIGKSHFTPSPNHFYEDIGRLREEFESYKQHKAVQEFHQNERISALEQEIVHLKNLLSHLTHHNH